MNLILFLAFLAITGGACAKDNGGVTTPSNEPSITIPLRGNTFVTACTNPMVEVEAPQILDTWTGEIKKWDNQQTVLSFYANVGKAGTINLAVDATAGTTGSSSTLQFSMGTQSYNVDIQGGATKKYEVGNFTVSHPGYIKIDVRGIKRTGSQYGNITNFILSGTPIEGENHFIPTEKLEDAYWYRRGPSVHMNYDLPAENIEYFYNEAEVPVGHDVNGTYFMLTGFGEGYMGIQSIKDDNGNNENKVLFSVWSPYDTDNPNEIPDDMHVKILKTGKDVTAQNFGNEGSGKQSFMSFPWEAGKTYRTLVSVKPDGKGNTIYTGYFGDDKGNWYLLSQLLRPKTDTYYTRPHSFLECFLPETSYKTRSVKFKNQWVRDKSGKWFEITDGTFTCDNTGIIGVRTDLFGGVKDNSFFLQNCGFFDDTTSYKSKFHRQPEGKTPQIDFNALENL